MIGNIQNRTSIETQNRLVVVRGWGGGWGVTAHGDVFSFGGMRMFWNQIEVVDTQQCECDKLFCR